MPYIAKNTPKTAEARVGRSNEKGIVAEPAIHDRRGLGATGKQRGDLTVRFHLCRKAGIEKIEEHACDMAAHSLAQCKAGVDAVEGQERGSASDAVICNAPNIDMCARLRGKADTMRARSDGETATIRPEGPSKGQAIDFGTSTANRTTEMAARPSCRAKAPFFPSQPCGNTQPRCWVLPACLHGLSYSSASKVCCATKLSLQEALYTTRSFARQRL